MSTAAARITELIGQEDLVPFRPISRYRCKRRAYLTRQASDDLENPGSWVNFKNGRGDVVAALTHFRSAELGLTPKELVRYGLARARDLAFEAVSDLWERRQREGLTQKDLASRMGADKGWVSKNLRGPGNWTMKTFGAFVVALDGELEIKVHALEDTMERPENYDAYDDHSSEKSQVLEAGNSDYGKSAQNDYGSAAKAANETPQQKPPSVGIAA
jgi:transcriptional regulator with XRE-family HTH domain